MWELSQWIGDALQLSKFAELAIIIFGAYQFYKGRKERNEADAAAAERARIDSNYQAWQVINSAQGKGGSGGRIEALGDLLRNGVSLNGIRLDDAWLEEVQLPRARMVRSSLRGTNFTRANLAGANLEGADLTDADLLAADLTGANLRGATLVGARLSASTLDGADLREVVGWQDVRSMGHASVVGVRNAPPGFLQLARGMGAVDAEMKAAAEDGTLEYSQHFRAI
ncbi:pentapeptide repeat-containing protein [Roseisolibacter sp. H3M3-2]|uniref:pentapeptide repeat-containing protein n=1 Tax=Roseisolibacter sp. H3M3-2 TaxID=3031323 RepID=UPI0023DB444F|nr:pentapeptide repeat-containing protein [Roseisolibacter sp. H3M3-2]MDF1504610.1 pentapeptide repeat-containing protein [Roseisolibacter sp. H3M3-2]